MQHSLKQKIQDLQKEIDVLKKTSKKKVAVTKKTKLEGMLKGIEFSEKEIQEAKRSLFPYSSK